MVVGMVIAGATFHNIALAIIVAVIIGVLTNLPEQPTTEKTPPRVAYRRWPFPWKEYGTGVAVLGAICCIFALLNNL